MMEECGTNVVKMSKKSEKTPPQLVVPHLIISQITVSTSKDVRKLSNTLQARSGLYISFPVVEVIALYI